ncbi:MAG: hypothetical protein ACD_17C00093G0002 [uncultured bacterium]|nr:MAG: hypothetical protein ACD_17C00093G0002 [uncultured bacterium]OGN55344.1 MAG: hypothetical protein A2796_02280 [Chlamydiae bacterium RIFCSPHIGHO2_01_FULL_44_39]OGN59847.1 MAG: hypothetical protein A3D96_03595 [Chlamydiae bacterium RIFCSPHIGHO2_12_FULL_44_59]OGN66054.1 MAG: hypothetical protein A2978_04110 [Chlamydiae bacterium RIFCSPLOWO2_01_FULL_44_52]OGN68590.1 MAG: hypothetical protein A3I67_02435 [Chlamydiae bacterium RIFCSPLOWO2_02_FULL_45_22]OGN69702.1 MAG: hypothetical protein A3
MSWDASEKWYTACVGEKGHYYHEKIVLPRSLKLLGSCSSLLDLGCGQGVLARHLPQDVDYVGIDTSQALVDSAKKLTKNGSFYLSDATKTLPIHRYDFDRITLILSLQNMENGQGAIQNAARHLKQEGKLLIVINHPAFRIPRQSNWEIDEKMKLQYRRVNLYMSPQKIPIQTAPSKGSASPQTISYHHPLSTYFSWLSESFVVRQVEEWCSDKKSEGRQAALENRARKEFPLFLAITASKGT